MEDDQALVGTEVEPGQVLSGRSRNLRSRNLVDWTQNDEVPFGERREESYRIEEISGSIATCVAISPLIENLSPPESLKWKKRLM